MYKSESSAQTISMKYSHVFIKIKYLSECTPFIHVCIYQFFLPISLYLYIYIFVYPWVGPGCIRLCQAEAAVIRAVDVATPATVAVVVAVATVAVAAIDSASAGFWLGESQTHRDGRMVGTENLAIFKKREVYQFINFWGGGLFQRFFGMFTPQNFGKMNRI